MSDSDHVQAVLKEVSTSYSLFVIDLILISIINVVKRDGLELTLSETKSQIAQLEMQHREDIAHLKSQARSLSCFIEKLTRCIVYSDRVSHLYKNEEWTSLVSER